MRKIIFIGRSEAGKTTLTQAMKGKKIVYHKTQYINHYDVIIDTPGEYAETKELAGSLAVYSAEADVVGLLISATEPFSLYPPNVTAQSNREVVGIVTKCDHWAANPEQAADWLRLAGCKKIFMTSSFTGEGIADIISYLKEEMQVMADGIGTDDPYLTAFLKYKNIQSLNRGIMVELIKAVWVHENGEITVDFNFADEYQRIIDYIENNHNVIQVIESKAI